MATHGPVPPSRFQPDVLFWDETNGLGGGVLTGRGFDRQGSAGEVYKSNRAPVACVVASSAQFQLKLELGRRAGKHNPRRGFLRFSRSQSPHVVEIGRSTAKPSLDERSGALLF
jgi:hypothetical protein